MDIFFFTMLDLFYSKKFACNVSTARFPLHQGWIIDSLPPLDGSCCDGSRSACGYARPCLAPSALHDEGTC